MLKYLLLLIVLIIVICLICSINKGVLISGVTEGGFDTPLSKYKKTPEIVKKSKGCDNILGTYTKLRKTRNPPLAKKLTDAGWKLYVKESCPWCHLQVDMFGEDKQYLNIIDCSKMEYPENKNPANLASDCGQMWVYPTWVNGNKILPGSQSFASLTDALKGKYYNTQSK